ncbi:MAG TPA: hypothetical protein VFZ59_23145, partial [Verrucomicrobiae bacterium]|nr:hypothetical protein [Verrucomicrobiae bacterium]
DELMAVAKVHFPDFPEKLLALICARAMQSEGYLKSMEFAARYAAALAGDRKRETPNLKDVEEAIQRMMPSKAAPEKSPVKDRLTGIQSPIQTTGNGKRIPMPSSANDAGEHQSAGRFRPDLVPA